MDYDVVIIGAGPSGIFAALTLADLLTVGGGNGSEFAPERAGRAGTASPPPGPRRDDQEARTPSWRKILIMDLTAPGRSLTPRLSWPGQSGFGQFGHSPPGT